MRSSIWSMKAYRLETISRINPVSSSSGVARIFGISRPARVAETAIAGPAVEQESAHLADQCRSMIDQALARAVERLDVLLFERLLRHEPHVPYAAGPCRSPRRRWYRSFAGVRMASRTEVP